MATTKVKGTSKKIKELKGIEDIRPEKITDEQLEKVQIYDHQKIYPVNLHL